VKHGKQYVTEKDGLGMWLNVKGKNCENQSVYEKKCKKRGKKETF
jgi:hypothetical protein